MYEISNNKIKNVIKYDYNFLKQYVNDNNIILLDDYSNKKVYGSVIIKAKCLNYYCDNIVEKKFIQIIKNNGCYCNEHTKENIIKKRKDTCLKKYGCESPMQNKDIKNKLKETNFKKYGVESALQNQEIKNKVKMTNLKKYGVEYILQNKDLKNKLKQNNLNKYGVVCTLHIKDIQNKLKQNNLEKYGVEYPLQSEEIKNKIKMTNLEKYGCENPFQNEEIKNKIKQTCLEKYGVEYPQQNTELSEKSSKNAYKSKDYIFPSGRIERIQGYEHFMLDELLQQENVSEDDIIVSRANVPSVWYNDIDGKKRKYFVDCFIKSQNRCIEVKSTWTAKKKYDNIFLKQQALKDAGYECEIWIYNKKGEKVECHK